VDAHTTVLDRPATPAPAEQGSRRGAGRWRGLPLTLATGICAAGPVIAATARAVAGGWRPAGDQANIATNAYDVLTSHMPLLGLHSDVSAVTGHDVYSLGPMLFWFLALPARIGAPAAMTLAIGVLNTACIAGSVLLARRRGGLPLMFLAAVSLVLMERSLAPEVLHDIWNPSAGLFPFTLLIFLCWGLACGELRLAPLALLVASFVLQCQLAFAPPCVALLAVGFLGLVVARRRQRRAPAPGRPRLWPWVAASAAVLAICWATPVVQQFQGSPGNLTRVEETATASPPKMGAAVGWHAVVRAVGVRPWWLRNPASPWERKYEVRRASSSSATVSAVLILAGLLAVGAVGLMRGRQELWSGAALGLVLCAALAAVAASTPTKRVLAETLGYTMWWGSPAGMFVWIALLWGPLDALVRLAGRSGPVRVLAAAGGVAATAAAAAAVAAAQRPDYHRVEYHPIRQIAQALDRAVPSHRTVLLTGALGADTFRMKMAARYALLRHGVHPLSPGKDVRLGSWYDLDHRSFDCSVQVNDGARRPHPGAVAVAHVELGSAAEPHPVTVWVFPAGCPAARGPAQRRSRTSS
jgi:hypothetical protein